MDLHGAHGGRATRERRRGEQVVGLAIGWKRAKCRSGTYDNSRQGRILSNQLDSKSYSRAQPSLAHAEQSPDGCKAPLALSSHVDFDKIRSRQWTDCMG